MTGLFAMSLSIASGVNREVLQTLAPSLRAVVKDMRKGRKNLIDDTTERSSASEGLNTSFFEGEAVG